MNKQWQSFISHYSSLAIGIEPINNSYLFDLTPSYALLEFSGEDAKSFLQGQLTNDINELSNEISQLSGYCNPKGRLLCLFHIFSINDKIYLQFPLELLAKIQKRLQMFVMMSKVSIRNCTEELINIAIVGKDVKELLSNKFSKLPENEWSVVTENNLTLINLSFGQSNSLSRIQILGAIEPIQNLSRELLSAGVLLSDKNSWLQLDIQAGLPSIVENTYQAFVPQMVNLDVLAAVNFKKGCYTGQEIVARLHYLGKPKRLMYKIEFESDNEVVQKINVGDDLYSPDSDSAQGAAKIVSLASLSKNKKIALAVIELKIIEKETLFIDESCTIKATVFNLPYQIKAITN